MIDENTQKSEYSKQETKSIKMGGRKKQRMAYFALFILDLYCVMSEYKPFNDQPLSMLY